MSWQKVWERIESRNWVRIWNRGTASVKELLIYGGQLDGKETGHFHTGAKQTADALTMLGTEFIITSSDSRGPYAITFRTFVDNTENVGDEMVATVHRPNVESEELNLMRTSYAGTNMATPVGDDDNKHFKSVCQLLINAAEAAEAKGMPEEYGLDKGYGGCFNDGMTQVFIDVIPDIEDIYDYFGFYFKSGAVNLREMVGGKRKFEGTQFRWWKDPNRAQYRVDIWETANSNNSYSLYMQVGSGKAGLAYLVAYKEVAESEMADRYQQVRSGIGDYVIVTESGYLLNSDRTISDLQSANQLFASSWSYARDVEAISAFLLSASDPRYIERWFPMYTMMTDRHLWREAYERVFPTGCIADSQDNVNQYAADTGYMVLELDPGLSQELEACGVKTAKQAAGYVDDGLKVRKPTEYELKAMKDAEALLRVVGAAADGVTYEVIYEKTNNAIGHADHTTKVVRIWHGTLERGVSKTLLATMAHEHRHIISKGADDNTVRFTDAADNIMADIAMMVKDGRLKAA